MPASTSCAAGTESGAGSVTANREQIVKQWVSLGKMRRSIEPPLSRSSCTCKCANIDDAADIDWVGCSQSASEHEFESVSGFKDNCTTTKKVPRLAPPVRVIAPHQLVDTLTAARVAHAADTCYGIRCAQSTRHVDTKRAWRTHCATWRSD